MNRIIRFLYPEYCVICGKHGSFICANCLNYRLDYIAKPFCPKCSGRLRGGRFIHKLCQRSSNLSGAVAITEYSPYTAKILAAVKYRFAKSDAVFLGQIIKDRLERINFKAGGIVPIPLSGERLKWRGFNQAELIAEATGLPVSDCLIKTREVPQQAGATRTERLKNPKTAFRCVLPLHKLPRRVYLLDDVMTTGATLEAAAAALKEAGNIEVFACVFARDDRNFKAKGLQ